MMPNEPDGVWITTVDYDILKQNLPSVHIIEQKYVFFYNYGGHFEYLKYLKGGNMPHTYKHYSLAWIMNNQKRTNFIIQF